MTLEEIKKAQEHNLELARAVWEKSPIPLDGLKILDIGCGNTDGKGDNCWEPENARHLAKLGADVIGIDIGGVYQPSEPYRHIQANLVYQNLKDLIPKDFKPEIVLAAAFFDSPTLDNIIFSKAWNSEPERARIKKINIESVYESSEWKSFLERESKSFSEFGLGLCRQVCDIMADSGIFIVENPPQSIKEDIETTGLRYFGDVWGKSTPAYGKC